MNYHDSNEHNKLDSYFSFLKSFLEALKFINILKIIKSQICLFSCCLIFLYEMLIYINWIYHNSVDLSCGRTWPCCGAYAPVIALSIHLTYINHMVKSIYILKII